MLNKKYPSLDRAHSGLGFGLNKSGLEKLQELGLFQSYSIRSFADVVFKSWRMRNDAFLIRFNDTVDGFGFVYESQLNSIEEGWSNFASKWIVEAEDYFSGAYDKRVGIYRNYTVPRTVESLKGFLCFGADRSLYDRTLIEAVINGNLTFELYEARIKHLQKLAENHIKRHAKRFYLDQITDTTDIENPVFTTVT